MSKLLSKQTLKLVFNNTKSGAIKHAPTLMIIGSAVGMAITIYESVKAKPKCDEILAARKARIEELKNPKPQIVKDENGVETEVIPKEKSEDEIKEELKTINKECGIEFAKTIVKPVLAATATLGLMFGANYISWRRLRDMTALYEISSDALNEYKKKTKEVIGDKKYEEVTSRVAQDKFDKQVEKGDFKDVNYAQMEGMDYLMYDEVTGHLIRTTSTKIELAKEKINGYLREEGWPRFVSIADFYAEIAEGQAIATDWDRKRGFTTEEPFEPDFGVIELPNGTTVMSFDYSTTLNPDRGYNY